VSKSAFKKFKTISKEQRTSSYSELLNEKFDLPAFSTFKELKFNRFPCSISLIDLSILLFRFKSSCENLLQLIIPQDFLDNGKLLQYKISLHNTIYQQIMRLIEIYAINILALDICGANKEKLETFFGTELIKQIFSGKSDNFIFGCRHKLKGCSYSCFDFINRDAKYISDKYEPITAEVTAAVSFCDLFEMIMKY